jgi:hypothetical protein
MLVNQSRAGTYRPSCRENPPKTLVFQSLKTSVLGLSRKLIRVQVFAIQSVIYTTIDISQSATPYNRLPGSPVMTSSLVSQKGEHSQYYLHYSIRPQYLILSRPFRCRQITDDCHKNSTS